MGGTLPPNAKAEVAGDDLPFLAAQIRRVADGAIDSQRVHHLCRQPRAYLEEVPPMAVVTGTLSKAIVSLVVRSCQISALRKSCTR
jgi:hypothetical protein